MTLALSLAIALALPPALAAAVTPVLAAGAVASPSAAAAAAALLAAPAPAPSAALTIDASAASHAFTGHGGLSAGASSRLLWDYPAPQRDDILDFMFRPSFGMALHLLKVEIGGDAQSTDGTEPSHEHARGDLSCSRGYERFLIAEAKRRNPGVLVYGLSWGAPGWINNGSSFFGEEMIAYQTQWVRCIKGDGFDVDYIGVYNERYWGGADYVTALRASLDAAGFERTRIIIPDGGYDAGIIASALANATFNASFDGVGLHYACAAHAEVQEAGKLYWASEDWWSQPDWDGAATWGHLLNYNFVLANMTTTIAWSPLWSVYSNLEDQAAGLMLANEPWSGYYEVSPPIWTSAQWNQFATPGWRFLSVPSGSSGLLPGGGTYVSLVAPGGAAGGLTIILETFGKLSARCAGAAATGPQSLVLRLVGPGMPAPGASLFVWQTNATSFFERQPDAVVAADGSVSLAIGVEAMITLTTVASGRKGAPAAPIPASAPFPLPFEDDFTGYAEDAMAHFFSDQFGSFAVRGGRLTQVAPQNPGKLAWSGDADPFTLVGDVAWRDVSVEVSALIGGGSGPAALGAADGAPAQLRPCNASAAEQRWSYGTIAQGYVSNGPPGGAECLNAYGCGREAVFWSCVTTGGSCCGDQCYDGLKFTLAPSGQVVCALSAVGCLTAVADGGLTFSTCAPSPPPANQTFAFDAATGALALAGSGLCLSQPPPPPPPTPYVQVCSRIASYQAFSLPRPPTGYCVQLQASGAWLLTNAKGAIANGTVAAPGGAATTLRVSAVGTAVSAFADGVLLAQVQDTLHSSGMAGLGSGFHSASFGAFKVAQAS